MVDLPFLCANLKKKRSKLKQRAVGDMARLYSCLSRPSRRTEKIIAGWKEDFRSVYGDFATNLSSNQKLDRDAVLELYGISAAPGGDRTEALQLLFFAVQTYFSLLIKYVMADVLQGIRAENGFSPEEMILGGFAKKYGITNYCCADWYCWPMFELENGLADVLESIRGSVESCQSPVSVGEFQRNNSYDHIKQIYEAVIPQKLRHALGEYYTPDWLAESTLKSAVEAYGAEQADIADLSILDPTCGSGTFLFKAIATKRRAGCTLSRIVETVRGIDVNPLAVLTAKTNYLLSVLDLIDGESPLTIPVYIADVVKAGVPAAVEESGDFVHSGDPSEVVRRELAQNRPVVNSLAKADIVVGNPPWVNWEYMPEQYRRDTQRVWLDYGLFSAKGRELSFSKEDISVLITDIVIDRFLKDGGIIGFVLRQGAFKSAQNGAAFRKFEVKGTGVKVIKVEDLSKIRVFEHATNRTALFFARKGAKNTYPVPYYLWEKRRDRERCSFGGYSQLQEVMDQVSVTEQRAMPAVQGDYTSPWITADAERLDTMKKVLGANDYRARTGVFTGGANAVYWLKIRAADGDTVTVTNAVERARRKAEQVTTDLEKTFVFPMLKGSGVRRWNVSYDTYLLCPHTAQTKMRPVAQREMEEKAPLTMAYLRRFKADLDGRNGFAGWEKETQRREFHAILRVGDYTFSRYKVVWRYIASEFVCAVIGTVNDPYLGEKLLLPNEKIMYVSTQDENEAYYLCGILSSTAVAECVKSYMDPTSISAHVLNKLKIPPYDGANPVHREIAEVCRAGHGKNDVARYIERIDALAGRLYGTKEP